MLMLLTTLTNAQGYAGIKPGLSLNTTKQYVLKEGFKLVENMDDDVSVYKRILTDGSANYLTLAYTPNSKIVWKVMVTLGEYDNWDLASDKFIEGSELLRNNFGEPSSVEYRTKYPFKENDGQEMLALYQKKLDVWCNFNLKNTEILIELVSYRYNEASLQVHYINNKARDLYIKESNSSKL